MQQTIYMYMYTYMYIYIHICTLLAFDITASRKRQAGVGEQTNIHIYTCRYEIDNSKVAVRWGDCGGHPEGDEW